jgi:hypothetical protein
MLPFAVAPSDGIPIADPSNTIFPVASRLPHAIGNVTGKFNGQQVVAGVPASASIDIFPVAEAGRASDGVADPLKTKAPFDCSSLLKCKVAVADAPKPKLPCATPFSTYAVLASAEPPMETLPAATARTTPNGVNL